MPHNPRKGRRIDRDKKGAALPKGEACLNCKSRKVRCDAGKPSCTSCARHNRHHKNNMSPLCVYPESIKGESYDSGLYQEEQPLYYPYESNKRFKVQRETRQLVAHKSQSVQQLESPQTSPSPTTSFLGEDPHTRHLEDHMADQLKNVIQDNLRYYQTSSSVLPPPTPPVAFAFNPEEMYYNEPVASEASYQYLSSSVASSSNPSSFPKYSHNQTSSTPNSYSCDSYLPSCLPSARSGFSPHPSPHPDSTPYFNESSIYSPPLPTEPLMTQDEYLYRAPRSLKHESSSLDAHTQQMYYPSPDASPTFSAVYLEPAGAGLGGNYYWPGTSMDPSQLMLPNKDSQGCY